MPPYCRNSEYAVAIRKRDRIDENGSQTSKAELELFNKKKQFWNFSPLFPPFDYLVR